MPSVPPWHEVVLSSALAECLGRALAELWFRGAYWGPEALAHHVQVCVSWGLVETGLFESLYLMFYKL